MKRILFALCVFPFLIVGGNAEAAELERKANTYLDKQAEAERNHKRMGQDSKINTDWMKNFDTGAKKKPSSTSAGKDKKEAGKAAKK